MKSLIVLAALLSSVSSYANNVNCSMLDKDGSTIAVKLDTAATEGVMTKTVKGVASTQYFLKIYIMNDSAGYNYYEGLARAPLTGGDPMFFRMKYSQDTQITTLSISEVGAEKKDITQFSDCTFR